MIIRLITLLILISAFTGCIKTTSSDGSYDSTARTVQNQEKNQNQIISLLGNVLPEKQLLPKIREERETQLAEAQANYESDPENIDHIIWYGRRLAYLGQYEDAIHIYSVGLDLYPNSFKLLRHRGHRYITVRQFDKAIEDLQQAVFYARNTENEIEPDGLPNKLNMPLSNNKFNIWYHLGIAYYLKGNYDKAISSFKKCITFADNDDLLVAVTDWFYLTYQKIGNRSAADELLTGVNKNLRIIENEAYQQRIRMYQGAITPEIILDNATGSNGSLDPTLAYGAAQWYLTHGRVNDAKEIIEKILLSNQCDAFAYIAAEADKLTLQHH